MISETFRVITKHFEDPAITCMTTTAFPNHALQLRAQGIEARQSLFDLFELSACDGIGLVARPVRVVAEIQKLPNGVQRKPKLP